MTTGSPVVNLPSTSPVVRLWGEVVAGILHGEPARIEQALADEAVFYDAFLGTVTGAQDIARKLGRMKGRAFSAATAEVRTALADEDTCAIEWVQRLSTTAGPVLVEVASFCTVRDGRITRLCDYVQPLQDRKP